MKNISIYIYIKADKGILVILLPYLLKGFPHGKFEVKVVCQKKMKMDPILTSYTASKQTSHVTHRA